MSRPLTPFQGESVLTFRHADATGVVCVLTGSTLDRRMRSDSLAWCRAEVFHPGQGYVSRFGWIQFVRSTDNKTCGVDWELDPLEILGEVAHPFGYFGILPTLFDAPSRATRRDLEWEAQSFLTTIILTPGNPDVLQVQPLTGFSWGFTVHTGSVSTLPISALDARDWSARLPLLSAFSRWTFAADMVTS